MAVPKGKETRCSYIHKIFNQTIIQDKHLRITPGSLPLAHNAQHSTSYNYGFGRFAMCSEGSDTPITHMMPVRTSLNSGTFVL